MTKQNEREIREWKQNYDRQWEKNKPLFSDF